MVRTSGARSKIRRFLKNQNFERNRQMGKEMLDRQLKKMKLDAPDETQLLQCAETFGYKSVDALLAGIGSGDVSVVTVINRMFPQTQKEPEVSSLEEIVSGRFRGRDDIKIDDVGMLQFNFGKCCQPVPGEKVVGFITRGRGVTVHRYDCPNIRRANLDKERLVDLSWDVSESSTFVVRINLVMEDRKNILRDILNSIAEDDTNLKSTSIHASRGLARGVFIAEVKNLTHLNNPLNQIRKAKGVIDVSRYLGSTGSSK
jgi:GTP pyrophosphokinase